MCKAICDRDISQCQIEFKVEDFLTQRTATQKKKSNYKCEELQRSPRLRGLGTKKIKLKNKNNQLNHR